MVALPGASTVVDGMGVVGGGSQRQSSSLVSPSVLDAGGGASKVGSVPRVAACVEQGA